MNRHRVACEAKKLVTPLGTTADSVLVITGKSVAVGVPSTTLLATHGLALTVVFTAAGQVIAGVCASVTITVWLHVAVLPFTSVAVHVTVMFPLAKLDGASLVTVPIPQLSDVVGVPKATLLAVQIPASVFTFTVAGQAIVGS